ncbi:hypothetical protein [Cytobacillus praedii]|uniref:Uncharacterized protein n=1 Tax=Cytobacillus praedii TaxID=1742358 RepID=A0A4R1AQT5_9BACI|nr:hypothetical protein [Cytobacillus praedii]TCJ01903.1 hypothetical protein E0Y62_21845 [Cytobacillus praedii]
MLDKRLAIVSIPLIAVHFTILYFWIFDWGNLTTDLGLISWGGSILLGMIIYFAYLNCNCTMKNEGFLIKILFGSTLMTIILCVLTIMIEWISNSMP